MSILEDVPLIGYVQSKFDIDKSHKWLNNYWYVSIIASCVYLALLWSGRKWMSTRPAFNLRKSLILWNVGLAVFSMFGTVSVVPNFINVIFVHGLNYSLCNSPVLSDPQLGVWGFLFVFSKVIEFGDTAFIVLRKSPLVFLHWYHHVTVCIYSWYGLGNSSSAVGDWFAVMNYSIHSLMYSYYALKAAKVYVPGYIARIITILQISQMFGGLYVCIVNYKLSEQLGNKVCESNYQVFVFGLAVYGSYAVLFLHFFYKKYC